MKQILLPAALCLVVLPALAQLEPGAEAGAPTAADSLPAFKSDSLRSEPFRQLEAGSEGKAQKTPQTKAARDSVTSKLHGRGIAVSVYGGVGFIDLDAKEILARGLDSLRARKGLKILQNYEPVHLAFPFGFQISVPVMHHFDLVARTHSYWYQQQAILGDSLARRTGDEFYSLQANLGGVGLRYYVPPDILSVTGSIALYAQGVYYWQLGGAELYSNHGSAPARFAPGGCGYGITFGFQRDITGPWSLTGNLGFMHQEFSSNKTWSSLIPVGAPQGKVEWAATSLQASLNLWYHFGVKRQTPVAAADSAKSVPASAAPPQQGPGPATPPPAPAPVQK